MSFEEMAENAKSPSLPTEFKFDESPVRVVMKDGEPWFVAKDVCEILDHSNPEHGGRPARRRREGGTALLTPLAALRRC